MFKLPSHAIIHSAKRPKAFWFRVHHWVGLKLSLFLTFILLTGTLAVVSNEIDWLFDSNKRAVPNGEMLSLGQLVDNAQEAYPNWQIQLTYAPLTDWFAVNITAKNEQGIYRRIYVDPYSGEVNGDSSYLTVQRFLREVHRNIMLPTVIGIPIVTSFSFLMILSLVSGLKTYKKFLKGFFKKPSNKNSRTWWGGMHRLLGLWSIPLLILVVLTSWWYLAEVAGLGATNYRSVYSLEKQSTPQLPMAHLQTLAEQAYPELEVTHLVGNSQLSKPVVFWGNASANLVRERANFIALDPYSGKVVELHKGEMLNFYQRISEMADPLHFGTFGGIYTKWIWFFLGILLTSLSITGAMVYTKRINKTLSEKSEWFSYYWHGMGAYVYLSVALVITTFIAWIFREY